MVPSLYDVGIAEKIEEYVLKANQLRYEAYLKEQEAIKIMNREVLGL